MTTITYPLENFLDDKGNLVFDYFGTKISIKKGNGTHFWILYHPSLEIWMYYYEKENSYVCRVYNGLNEYDSKSNHPSVAFESAVYKYKFNEIMRRENVLNKLLSSK